MGIAAIIAAISPMVVASIQAKADVKIAEINSETQKTLTTITADTSKYLADQQKDIALTQSGIAQQISSQNNAAVTQRLDMQLAQLSDARNDARKAEAEKRQLDYYYQQQRIQLAQKQANDNLDLAKQTLSAQLTQAGLSQGFSNSTNSGDRLGIGRTGLVSAASSSSAAATRAFTEGEAEPAVPGGAGALLRSVGAGTGEAGSDDEEAPAKKAPPKRPVRRAKAGEIPGYLSTSVIRRSTTLRSLITRP